MGESLYQHWPLMRLVLESARLTVVHNARLRDDLRGALSRRDDRCDRDGGARSAGDAGASAIAGTEVADALRSRVDAQRSDVRARHGMPADAIVVAAFGGMTPEKRIGPLVRALSAMADRHPRLCT